MAALEKNKAKKENIKIAVEILVAIGTIANVIVFWLVSSNQRVDTLNSIVKADSSLILTKQSIELAQENSIIENRAWIGLEYPPKFEWSLDALNNRVIIKIKNFGKTPAESLYVWDTLYIRYDKRSFSPAISIAPPNSPRVMSPNESITFGKDIVGTETNPIIQKIRDGKAVLYCCGVISYQDIFGKFNSTIFTYRYDATTSIFVAYGGFNWMK